MKHRPGWPAEEQPDDRKESRQALALQRFAEANPQLLEEIRELDAREQAQQIEWAFEDAAEEQGIQPWGWRCN